MKISIIIPFHRGIHFLEDCLESIRDQGIVDYEILLILDHVKEDIQPCIDQFIDLPIRTVEVLDSPTIERKFRKPITEELFKDCSGVAHARNIGIEEAKGKYIYFLDSDDYILEGTLPLLLKEAEERQAEFTYGKRVGTWFRRKAYLSSLLLEGEKEEKDEDEEEEKEDQDLDSDEDDINSEEDSDSERDTSTEHSSDDSSNVEDEIDSEGDSNREVDSQNYRGFEHQEALGDEIQIEEEGDLIDFTPMKRTRREKKIYKVERKLMRYQEGTKIELTYIAEAYYTLLVVKKGIKNLSVLGILFQKEFIDRNKLRFNEAYMFFSDAPFVIQALKEVKTCTYVEEAVYVKRKHNDPIHYPALSQVKVDDRFDEFIQAYKEGRLNTFSDSALRTYIENKFIAYFVGTYAPLLRRGKSDLWRDEHLEIMRSCMREVDGERIRRLSGYKKRVVKALIDGKDKKLVRTVNLHLAKKKLKKIRKNRRLFGYYLYHHYFVKMEVKENWVLCESFLGKNYSDSPKYIYEYLSTKYPGKYRFIWIINKKGTKIPYNHTKVKRFSIRYCYYLARCKYDVFNMRQPDWMRKRDENIFLETWHGTPLKKLVFDQEEVMGATPLYKAQVYRQSRQWDYLVSANHFSTEVFQSAFLFDKEILEYGYPRNDILHHPEKDQIGAEIRKKLGVPTDKKTILYAPTWRDDEYYGRGEYKFALKLDLHYMRRKIGEEYVILLRTHYFIADALDTTGLEGFAWNVSKYDDISELYLISDLLITDYSSVFFDYANLKRPILFYTYDLEKYRDMLRGFYMDIEKDVPGPLLFTTEEVTEAIENIDEIIERYSNKYEIFYEKFCSLEDGHASENIAKRVFGMN